MVQYSCGLTCLWRTRSSLFLLSFSSSCACVLVLAVYRLDEVFLDPFRVLSQWRIAKEVAGAHDKAVTCIAGYQLTSCETLFASTSSDGTVRFWQASLPKKTGGNLLLFSLIELILHAFGILLTC